MIRLLDKIRNKAVQTTIILLLTLGITGLGGANGVQLFCEPECPMHQAQKLLPSCCDPADADHLQLAAVPAEQHQSPDPCCDGKLCFDSPIEIKDTAIFGQAVHDSPVLQAPWLLPDLPAVERSTWKLSFNFYHRNTGPPIYKRTCSYLI